MLKILALLSVLLLPANALAQEVKKWEVNPAESTLVFTGKQMGSSFNGSFSTFAADIAFDPAMLEQSKVTVTIDVSTALTKDKERDANIQSKEWFDTATFPSARFETTAITKTGDNAYEATANLTIRDITNPVVMPFTLEFSKDDSGKEKVIMKGSVTLDRSKFSLGTGDWADASIIANEVPVDVLISATAVQ